MLNRLLYIIINVILLVVFIPLIIGFALFTPITGVLAVVGFITKGEFKKTKYFDSWIEFAMSPCLIFFMIWVDTIIKLEKKLVEK